MAELVRRAPPILIYTTVSAGLLAIVVARALDKYQNFFAAAFALSHSNGSILVMANTASLLLYLFGRGLQALFFGQLRPVEVERLYQRGGFFVTDFMLAFATFREAFGISSGIMVSVLLFIKCFHWLLSDRIEAMDQLPYPGPRKLEHARLLALFFTLWACDSILLTYSLDAVMQHGIGLVVLFAAEYAILMVNLTQALLKYVLYVLEIRRATRVGGAIAPPWEEKPIYSFYIELSTAFVELTIYLTYFAIMSIYHSIPIYAIRDVYVAGSLFITRSLAFVRYKRAMRALDMFDTPTQQELDSKSDKTCIVCREELNAIPPGGAPPADNGAPGSEPDTSNGPPKRLPCGHIFHRNCLRSWFERQLTCPTCRQRVDDKLARANVDANRAGAGVGGNNQGGDAAPQPGVAGVAQPNNRRPATNGLPRAQVIETGQGHMREPLRFEGFYLQAGAFVPWVGGPLLARDPTQTGIPHRHTTTSQRVRHPAAPSAHVHPPTPSVSAAPVISSTPSASSVWPPSTPTLSTPSAQKPSSEAKPKMEDEDSDGDSDSSVGVAPPVEERRRILAEAALQRTASSSQQRPGASIAASLPTPTATAVPAHITPSTAAGDGNIARSLAEREIAYRKYFAPPTESLSMSTDGTAPTPSAKPMSFLAPRHSIANTPLSGDYNVRSDAPSFIPLFHSFHLPHYSAAAGQPRPWPLQKVGLPTQTLPLPGQTASQTSVPLVPPLQTHASALNPIRMAPYPARVAPQSPSSVHLQQQHPPANTPLRPDTLFLRGNIKREPSPSQELSAQQLDVITRLQVEERLRVLENVKRMTQQCIDELLAVRGSIPSLEAVRPHAQESKLVVEPQSIFITETSPPSAPPLEQAPSAHTPALKSIGSMLTSATPILEPEVVLAAGAAAVGSALSTPSPSTLMAIDPLSFSVTEESTETVIVTKQEEVPATLGTEVGEREEAMQMEDK